MAVAAPLGRRELLSRAEMWKVRMDVLGLERVWCGVVHLSAPSGPWGEQCVCGRSTWWPPADWQQQPQLPVAVWQVCCCCGCGWWWWWCGFWHLPVLHV